MAVHGTTDVEQFIKDLLQSIPGPQDGESIAAFRSRINGDALLIVKHVIDKKEEFDQFIAKNSNSDYSDASQRFVASRRRFMATGEENDETA